MELDKDLAARQEARTLAAQARNAQQAAAAKKVGISARTMRRYMADPEFYEAYQQAHARLVEDATQRMQRGLNSAVDTLQQIATDQDAGKTARVAAARSLLEQALRYTELSDLLGRIAKLEELAGDRR